MRMMLGMAALMILSACSVVSRVPDFQRSPAEGGEAQQTNTDRLGAPAPAPAGPEGGAGNESGAAAANQGESIALAASQLLGTPYHFGGADVQGFDCSGLAVYAHEQAGVGIPRTAQAQKRAAQPVSRNSLAPGDLVFFRIGTRHVNHVGIYFGDGRFIHAPRKGEVVSYGNLEDPYYRKRYAGAGRFWNGSALQVPAVQSQGGSAARSLGASPQ